MNGTIQQTSPPTRAVSYASHKRVLQTADKSYALPKGVLHTSPTLHTRECSIQVLHCTQGSAPYKSYAAHSEYSRQVLHCTQGSAPDSRQVLHCTLGSAPDSTQVLHCTQGSAPDSRHVLHCTQGSAPESTQVLHCTQGSSPDKSYTAHRGVLQTAADKSS